MKLKKIVLAAVIIFSFSLNISAAPLFNLPLKLIQPDGTVLNVYQSGDEFYNWVHDKPYSDPQNWHNSKENYTILQNQATGYYVYAVIENGKLVPSEYTVGKVDPASVGIEKGLNVMPDISEHLRLARAAYNSGYNSKAVVDSRYNLVFFIRFKGESEFAQTASSFESVFNGSSGPSVQHYYNETSSGKLTVSSAIYPTGTSISSYQDTYVRGYYQPYSSTNTSGYSDDTEKSDRETALIGRALSYVKSYVPSGASLDGDSDGYIDNIVFIIYGSSGAWDDLLWSHMTTYSGSAFTINSKKVSRYNFIMQNQFDWSTLAHEIGHTLGMPDLYHYVDSLNPIGIWDLMASNYAHMSNYMKWRYLGWISSIPEITSSGTYWLRKSSAEASNVIYKIKSPNSPVEYFILEYRFRTGNYETYLPGSGLVVYRVNPGIGGNAYGPPDEIYIYRPNGTTTSDGSISSAYFNSSAGRTQINDSTNPSSFLSDGSAGGLSIKNIGSAGDSISFYVDITGTCTNEYKVEQTSYNWQDISSSGTKITNWINGTSTAVDSSWDDGYSNTAIPLGFNFTFYGQVYNSIYVGINGLVSFSYKYLNIGDDETTGAGIYGYFSDSPSWPGNKFFPNSIAVAYKDFDLNKNDGYGGGRILYKTINNKFYLTWLNVGTFETTGDTTNTFQLVLDGSDNSATINYKKFGLSDTRSSIKVGIQKSVINGLGWVNSGDITDRIPTDGSSVKFSLNSTTDIEDLSGSIPVSYALSQNYPNPFNPATNVTFNLPSASRVVLKVYDALGREVMTAVDAVKDAGNHKVRINASKLASGVYIYQICAYSLSDGKVFNEAKKMMVLK